jgi:hypothetical protein
MRIRIFALVAIVALLALAGVAAAQSTDSGINAGVVRCVDAAGSCNDFVLNSVTIAPGYMLLNGYEYGCGYTDRIATGSGRIVGNTMYVGLTVNTGAVGGGGAARLGNRVYTIDRTTGAATYEYSYHYDSYHYGSGTGTWGPCPKGLTAGGPDESQ